MEITTLTCELKSVLHQLIKVLDELSYDEYNQKIELLGNASIGAHTRHIIEVFRQLDSGFETGIIDYDQRERNLEIQSNLDCAIAAISELISSSQKMNKGLELRSVYSADGFFVQTNYERELIYSIDHIIHHQAIIRIGLNILSIKLPNEHFGVAKSTRNFKKV